MVLLPTIVCHYANLSEQTFIPQASPVNRKLIVSPPRWSTLPMWLTPLSGNQDSNCHGDTRYKYTISGLTKAKAYPATKKWALQQVSSVSNNVSHRQQLPTDQTGRWPATAALGWRCRCSMVDVKWLVMHTITTTKTYTRYNVKQWHIQV